MDYQYQVIQLIIGNSFLINTYLMEIRKSSQMYPKRHLLSEQNHIWLFWFFFCLVGFFSIQLQK